MFKEGDLVTRKSHNDDVVFKIESIIGEIAYLKGMNVRLCADSTLDDLNKCDSPDKSDDESILKRIESVKNNQRNDYFYIPGKILHIDGDNDYLNRCLNFYKKAGVLAYGVYSKEENMPNNISKYISDINPDIIVITGHDSNIKNNSKYFSEAVKMARKFEKDYDKLIIIAGACQSNYELLIRSGANFASSPKRINIHALDPAVIATTLSLSDKNTSIDLITLLEKTSGGKDGIGGVCTKGMMQTGYPRWGGFMKDKIKKDLRNLMGKKISILVDAGRGKMDKYIGVITKCYNNVWMFRTNGEEKSFTYTDIIIKNVILD